jgi:hypothetical protein
VRKVIFIVAILVVVVAAAAAYLVFTTPAQNATVRFPLSATQRALVAQVPASAEAFAFIPGAAGLEAKLRANAITADAIDDFQSKQALPEPWMIGRADVVAWKTRDGNRYLVHLDPFRAFLVRSYAMLGGDISNRIHINISPEPPIAESDLQQILTLAEKLPPGDAFVVQRAGSRGAFPPIARPAVSSVSINAHEIGIVSRAASTSTEVPPAISAHFAQSAVLSASFGNPPRVVDDLNRLFGAKVSSLLENGGSLVVYDVDEHKLLPRPIGVIAVPDDPQRRTAMSTLANEASKLEALGVRPRTAEGRNELILSFDNSIDTYLKDALVPASWPANLWTLRADPQRLVPILSGLSDNVGLRVAAPRLFRSARDLNRWIGALQKASAIEAAASSDGVAEQLNVRVTTK